MIMSKNFKNTTSLYFSYIERQSMRLDSMFLRYFLSNALKIVVLFGISIITPDESILQWCVTFIASIFILFFFLPPIVLSAWKKLA